MSRNGKKRSWRVDRSGRPYGICDTQADVALALGIAPRTLRYWRQRMPVLADGRYDVGAIYQWYHSIGPGTRNHRLTAQQQEAANERLVQRQDAEARLKVAQARAAELGNELTERDIVYRQDIERFFALFFQELTDHVSRLPEDLKPSFCKRCGTQATLELEQKLHITLRALSDFESRVAEIGR